MTALRVSTLLLFVSACVAPNVSVVPVSAALARPRTILMRGEWLAEAKAELQQGNEELQASLAVLRDSAESALGAAPLSVMQKKRMPPSGNKHDFMSMAPYWWPDTTKPGGLPFVRRDGVVYPESRLDHDGLRLQKTIDRVEALALAHFLTGDARYSRKAAQDLRVFFLDTATAMHPHLEYGQAVLGVNDGRGTGIIDTRDLPRLVDAVRLLDGAPGWTPTDSAAMVAWSWGYLKWLVQSKNGKEERAATNNHGTFYDAQLLALALHVGDTLFARTVVDSARARIAFQIRADGKQPLELERTRPLHYSVFNLDAFTMLAEMGRQVRADLWRFTAANSASIEKALRFVAPYANTAVKFPAVDLTPVGTAIFLLPLRRASAALRDAELIRALQQLPWRERAYGISRFAYPSVP
ncbi:MAG: alginate lyase family protein [Gemmatimonadota bacterium]